MLIQFLSLFFLFFLNLHYSCNFTLVCENCGAIIYFSLLSVAVAILFFLSQCSQMMIYRFLICIELLIYVFRCELRIWYEQSNRFDHHRISNVWSIICCFWGQKCINTWCHKYACHKCAMANGRKHARICHM